MPFPPDCWGLLNAWGKKMPQYPATIDIGTLTPATGYVFAAENTGDQFFGRINSAGDVNGDGFDDLIIGARYASPHGLASGAAYVVFGGATRLAALDAADGSVDATIWLSQLNGANGFQLSGVAAYDEAGFSVASAGDINGDGFDEVIVGAPGADPHGLYSGAAYVVFGKAAGFAANVDLSSLSGNNSGFRMNGGSFRDYAGWSVSSAGDMNGDGLDDIIVGATEARDTPLDTPGFYLVFPSSPVGYPPVLELANLNGFNGYRFIGPANDANGYSVASAGDVNGDGFNDIIVGAITGGDNVEGAAYVVFGGQAKLTGFDLQDGTRDGRISLSLLDGTNGFRLEGESRNDRAGRNVAAGDINGDGFSDLIIGAEQAEPPAHDNPYGYNTGAVYVVYGAPSFAAHVELSSLNGSNGFRIEGDDAGNWAGWSVDSVEDFNGDGFDDVLFSTFEPWPGNGTSYLLFGKAGGFAAVMDVTDIGPNDGISFVGGPGYGNGLANNSVTSAGDVNGDGLEDLFFGSQIFDASYLVLSRLPQAAVNLTGTAGGQTLVGGNFDDVLNGAGGDDELIGNAGKDVLSGGDDDDTLIGGSGLDILNGDNGDDTLVIRDGDLVAGELYDGGLGTDTLQGLVTTALDLSVATVTQVENLKGFTAGVSMKRQQFASFTGTVDTGAITLVNAGTVTVSGAVIKTSTINLASGGNDLTIDDSQTVAHIVRGGAGNDVVNVTGAAGLGFTLTGGAGLDKLFGGAGTDTFIIAAGHFVAGEVYNGRSSGGSGDILQGLVPTAVDLSVATVTNIENLIGFNTGVSMTRQQLLSFDRTLNTGTITLTDGGSADISSANVLTQTINLSSSGNNLTLVDHALVSHVINGGAGNDVVTVVLAGMGVTLRGGGGLDKLYGGDANDTLVIGDGDVVAGEVYHGGLGVDTLQGLVTTSTSLSDVTLTWVENLTGFTAGVSMKQQQLQSFSGLVDTGAITFTNAGALDISSANILTQTFNLSGSNNNFFTLADGAAVAHVVNGAALKDTLTVVGPAGLGVTLDGQGGDDKLYGGDGDDTLIGGGGLDKVYGGAGDDILMLQDGDLASGEVYKGGSDSDTLHGDVTSAVNLTGFSITEMESMTGFANGVALTRAQLLAFTGTIDTGDITLTSAGTMNLSTVNLETQTLYLSSTGNNNVTVADSSTVAHIVNGGSTNDTMTGVGAAGLGVTLSGGGGVDTLKGGAGDDRLIGGDGADALNGGAGNDLFVYLSVSESTVSSRDQINNFAFGDIFDLTAIDADISTSANDAFAFIGSVGFSNTAGELRAVISGINTIVSADVNGDGGADFQIKLAGSFALGAGDFLL